MDITAFPQPIQQLHNEFMEDLRFCSEEVGDEQRQIETSIQLCDVYRSRLYGQYSHMGFENADRQILFFKRIKPIFISELEYYARLQQLHLFGFDTIRFYEREILRIKRILHEHQSFVDYYENGSTHFDEAWFITGAPVQTSLSMFPIETRTKFTSPYDSSVSGLLAINRYLLCVCEKMKMLQ